MRNITSIARHCRNVTDRASESGNERTSTATNDRKDGGRTHKRKRLADTSFSVTAAGGGTLGIEIKTVHKSAHLRAEAATTAHIRARLSGDSTSTTTTASGNALRTFTTTAYNGGPLKLTGWTYPVVIDLEGVDGADKPRPVFSNHDPDAIVGHTTSIDVGRDKITADGMVSGTGQHVDEIINAHDNGFPFQASVGASVVRNQFVDEGRAAEANGETWKGPINIARKTMLKEISTVPLGADDDTDFDFGEPE